MNKYLKNAILFGMGAIYYSKEKIEEVIKDIQDENITPEESKKFVQEVMENINDFKKQHEGEVKETVSRIVKELNLATKADLEKVHQTIKSKVNQELARASESYKKNSEPKKATRSSKAKKTTKKSSKK